MEALLAKALVLATVIWAPCPGKPVGWSCAFRSNVAYVSPGSPVDERTQFWHEMGHIVDFNLLTDQDRGTFAYLIHDHRPWWSPNDAPGEQFAEAFRLCVTSMRWVSRRQEDYGYTPTLHQHHRMCRWMRTLG